MLRLALGALAFTIAVTPHRAAGQTAEQVVDRAVTAYKSIRTMRGSFEQTLRNQLTGSTMTARGDFEQELPNRIAIRFTDPAGDRIVVNGKVAWLYLPSSNPKQAFKMPAAGGGGSLNVIEQFLTSPATRYAMTPGGTAVVSGRPTHAVALAPKTTIPEFTRATIWVDDENGLIRQFEISEPSGLVRRIRMIEARLNVPVDKAAFTFTAPKGVQIVDQTGR
jgi:outer membrane lipoprotein carrier protein